MLLSDYLIQMLLLQYKAKGRRTAVQYLSRNYLSGKASRDATCRKHFYIRQVLYLKNPRNKKGLKVSVVWDTKSFKSTVVGIFKVVESRLFWSRFLVLLGHVRNLQVWRIWKNLTWDFAMGPNYRFIDRRKTKWKSAISPLRRVVYTCVCLYTHTCIYIYTYIWTNR